MSSLCYWRAPSAARGPAEDSEPCDTALARTKQTDLAIRHGSAQLSGLGPRWSRTAAWCAPGPSIVSVAGPDLPSVTAELSISVAAAGVDEAGELASCWSEISDRRFISEAGGTALRGARHRQRQPHRRDGNAL